MNVSNENNEPNVSINWKDFSILCTKVWEYIIATALRSFITIKTTSRKFDEYMK